jgi:hypothetical protein
LVALRTRKIDHRKTAVHRIAAVRVAQDHAAERVAARRLVVDARRSRSAHLSRRDDQCVQLIAAGDLGFHHAAQLHLALCVSQHLDGSSLIEHVLAAIASQLDVRQKH